MPSTEGWTLRGDGKLWAPNRPSTVLEENRPSTPSLAQWSHREQAASIATASTNGSSPNLPEYSWIHRVAILVYCCEGQKIANWMLIFVVHILSRERVLLRN